MLANDHLRRTLALIGDGGVQPSQMVEVATPDVELPKPQTRRVRTVKPRKPSTYSYSLSWSDDESGEHGEWHVRKYSPTETAHEEAWYTYINDPSETTTNAFDERTIHYISLRALLTNLSSVREFREPYCGFLQKYFPEAKCRPPKLWRFRKKKNKNALDVKIAHIDEEVSNSESGIVDEVISDMLQDRMHDYSTFFLVLLANLCIASHVYKLRPAKTIAKRLLEAYDTIFAQPTASSMRGFAARTGVPDGPSLDAYRATKQREIEGRGERYVKYGKYGVPRRPARPFVRGRSSTVNTFGNGPLYKETETKLLDRVLSGNPHDCVSEGLWEVLFQNFDLASHETAELQAYALVPDVYMWTAVVFATTGLFETNTGSWDPDFRVYSNSTNVGLAVAHKMMKFVYRTPFFRSEVYRVKRHSVFLPMLLDRMAFKDNGRIAFLADIRAGMEAHVVEYQRLVNLVENTDDLLAQQIVVSGVTKDIDLTVRVIARDWYDGTVLMRHFNENSGLSQQDAKKAAGLVMVYLRLLEHAVVKHAFMQTQQWFENLGMNLETVRSADAERNSETLSILESLIIDVIAGHSPDLLRPYHTSLADQSI